MVRHENEKGSVNVSTNVYTDIVGTAATNCFGVKGMAARSLTDGVYHLLRMESVSKGVHVEFHEDDTISIDDPRLQKEPRLAVVLGTEGEGLTDAAITQCDYTVKIPMYHGVDSLNVAAASAVAFWELRPR